MNSIAYSINYLLELGVLVELLKVLEEKGLHFGEPVEPSSAARLGLGTHGARALAHLEHQGGGHQQGQQAQPDDRVHDGENGVVVGVIRGLWGGE